MLTSIQYQKLQELEYIQVSPDSLDKLDLNKFPDFLLLGPQRTGSNWLTQNLNFHPEVFFSSPKELYFFNLLTRPNAELYSSNKLEWYLTKFSDSPISYLRKTLQTLANHQELYRPQVRGEGTASYAVLNKAIIREVTLLNPDIKVILTIRNPITRAWAHAKKDVLNPTGRDITEVPEQEFIDFFNLPHQKACGDYTTAIKQWLEFVSPEQLLILVFDDIAEQPQELLLKVFKFLEISADSKYVNKKLAKKKIHKTDKTSQNRDIPSHYRQILNNLFAEELVRLEDYLGRLPQR